MSFGSMIAELRGSVPKLPIGYAKTLVQRAWTDIRKRNLWSFQLYEGQWVSPPQFATIGQATATQGSNQIQLDATALAGLIAVLPSQSYSLLTQRQFRVAAGGTFSGVYNIWAADLGAGILFLDRPWGELTVTSTDFIIYQAYYVPNQAAGATNTPLNDHRAWISVRNIQYFMDLFTERYSRTSLDIIDPQRTKYQFPSDVVPYAKDNNPDSPTFGYFMYELWGTPFSSLTYQLLGIRKGPDLVKPTDTLPFAIGEDCLMALARYYAYEWAEANRDRSGGASGNRVAYAYLGPDYKFLMGIAKKEYDDLLRNYRRDDREVVDNWFFLRRDAIAQSWMSYYNTLDGTASPGAGWGNT